MRYAIIIEKGRTQYGAYVPDIPQCSAVGKTLEEVKESITDSVLSHLKGLAESGKDMPKATSICGYVDVE
ncbi:MAG: type II toxin-antitoxin system HicB family antitoxin [Microcystaceae cyanobacterium]